MTWEDKYVGGVFIYEQKNVWASLSWLTWIKRKDPPPPIIGKIQFKTAMKTTVCRCCAWTREFLLRHTDWTASHLHINGSKERIMRFSTITSDWQRLNVEVEPLLPGWNKQPWILQRGSLKAPLTQALLEVAMESKHLPSGSVPLDFNNNCNLIK